MNEGPLERYQFYYLLKNNKEIAQSIASDENYNISFTKFLYGFGRVSGMKQVDITDFQKEIDNFLNFSWEKNKLFKKNVMIVLLGITNHWNILVVERNFSNFKRTNKYYFLDSRNYYEIFTLGDNEKKRKKFKILSIITSTIMTLLIIFLKDNYITNFMFVGFIEATIMILPITYKLYGVSYNNYKNYNAQYN